MQQTRLQAVSYTHLDVYKRQAIDPWLTDPIYLDIGFKDLFDARAGKCMDGLYPTITVRQLMWALKMKPIPRERWETCFDKRDI